MEGVGYIVKFDTMVWNFLSTKKQGMKMVNLWDKVARHLDQI